MHAMLLSVLVAFLLCSNVIAEVSADTVSITASGAMHHAPLPPKSSSKTVRRHSQSPDDELPFVLDAPVSPGTFKPLPATASAAAAFDDSPFMLDDGTAPKAPLARTDSPFMVDEPLGPKAQIPDNAAVVQKQATEVNDSPFVLDAEQSQAPSSEPTSDGNSQAQTASPFVVDQLAEKEAEVNEDDDRDDQAHIAQLSKQIERKGPFTIVRNGLQAAPQPHTTQMVRNGHFGETTTAAPSSTGMEFELEGSLLETSSGQRFVPVPDTPFEMDMHVLSSRHRQPKMRIELQRQMPIEGSQMAPLSFNALGPNTVITGASAPVFYPAMVPVLNPTNAFMQNAMLTNQVAPVALQMAASNKPGSTISAASPPQGNDEAVASAPKPVGQTSTKSKPQIADADVPLSTKDTLNAPVVLPAPQIGPDSPANSSTKKKGKAVNNVSSSVDDAAASLGLNGTNTTLKGHVPAKAVTLRGAVIAIFLGLVVTIFFLSAVLWMLNAGMKPPEESESREPPRPTPSYRQLLRAQKPTTAQSSAASGPSV